MKLEFPIPFLRGFSYRNEGRIPSLNELFPGKISLAAIDEVFSGTEDYCRKFFLGSWVGIVVFYNLLQSLIIGPIDRSCFVDSRLFEPGIYGDMVHRISERGEFFLGQVSV